MSTKKTYPVTMGFVLMFCWAFFEMLWGRRKKEEEDQQETERINQRDTYTTLCSRASLLLFLIWLRCVFLFLLPWLITQAHARVTQNTHVFHWSFSGLWRTSNKYKLSSTKNWVGGVGFHFLELNVWIWDIWVWKVYSGFKTHIPQIYTFSIRKWKPTPLTQFFVGQSLYLFEVRHNPEKDRAWVINQGNTSNKNRKTQRNQIRKNNKLAPDAKSVWSRSASLNHSSFCFLLIFL